MNNKYWFYIEPHCFIHTNSKLVIIINTMSSTKKVFKKTRRIAEIVDKLMTRESYFCVELSDIDLTDNEVFIFIQEIRSSFSGDCVNQNHVRAKPIFPYPLLKLQRQISNLEKIDEISPGVDVLTYLKELTFYINSECKLNCSCCQNAFKQTTFCTKAFNGKITLTEIAGFVKKLQGSGLNVINIVGGDIFNYSELQDLVDFFNRTSYKIFYHSQLQNLRFNLIKLNYFKGGNGALNVNVNFPIDTNVIEEICSDPVFREMHCRWNFLVSSDDEFDEVSRVIEAFKIENVMVYPFYNFRNLVFFESRVFMEERDILFGNISKQTYFSRQIINENNFGKMKVLPQGTLFSNLNNESIGCIDDFVPELLFRELKNGNSWLNIRNMQPCSDCVYQWLCPSPSNYELAIGKPNLCHVKP